MLMSEAALLVFTIFIYFLKNILMLNLGGEIILQLIIK